MVDRVDFDSSEEPQSLAPGAELPTEVNPDRPAWLPEKFSSPEDMAKAYGELEGKLGQPETPTEQDPMEAVLGEETLVQYADKWQEQGMSFTDEDYASLAEKGLPRDFVDRYVDGQQAIALQQAKEIMDVVGGEQNYHQMAKWATETLSKAELDAYDTALDSGSESARLAVNGLYAQYTQKVGVAPNLIQGNSGASTSGAFQSVAEMKVAMKDPRYKTDPAYRNEVAQRAANSTAF